MRLHHLSMRAFGPFPGTEEIDFDALNGAGLFLLSGATGAGKTSILDAVCFALYGTVPGARGVKMLKSQHSHDRVAPEVVLGFSVRDRRFVVRRSPEWSRPKLRGTGMRTEKAAASLSEVAADGERLISSRAAEVGLTISELVGMQASQFQQVAMLPQGEFQRFLQATTAERHGVLQQLFRTARFAKIEEWVQEHSRRLREGSASGEQTVQRLIATIADRSGVDPPEELTTRPDLGRAGSWAADRAAVAARELREAAAAHAAAAGQVDTWRAELERRRTTAGLVRRRDEARSRLAALQGEAADAAAQQARLDADAAATGCLPLLGLLQRAADDASTAAAARARHRQQLRQSAVEGPDPDDAHLVTGRGPLVELARATRNQLARFEGALPTARALQADREAIAEAEVALARVREEQARAADAAETLPARLRRAFARVASLRASAGAVEALELRLEACRERTTAAAAVGETRRRLLRREDSLRDARDAAADAREQVQTLTQRRLDGYAAELGGALQSGEPCQVCGSREHPAPAVSSEHQVSPAEQQRAQEVLDRAIARVEGVTAEVTRLVQELADLQRRTGGRDEPTAAAEMQVVAEELAEARQAAARLPAAEREHDRLAAEVERCRVAAAELDVDVARLTESLQARHRSITETRTALAETVPEVPDPSDLPRRAELLSVRLGIVESLLEAESSHEDAGLRVAELEAEARAAAAAAGFGALAEVRPALLDADERDRLRHLLDERRDAVATVEAVLADPEVRMVEDTADPDVIGAQQALLDAEAETQALARRMHQREQRASALRDQVDRLDQALRRWAPTLAEAERAESMSRLVRGTGGDNQLQMRLSAYVLATRLDQVLAAANERLSHMRDQRYVLQRTARAHRKGTQAGLGLKMLDQWTGDVRDPATLSGGETFVVSLALALGLADVVTQEAGGTEIETLFVDEGFGTLDADTLDDVMDRLDALRAGGRSVGVVSHVTELRSRIPTQVHVLKTPTGSSIRVS